MKIPIGKERERSKEGWLLDRSELSASSSNHAFPDAIFSRHFGRAKAKRIGSEPDEFSSRFSSESPTEWDAFDLVLATKLTVV